VGTRHIEHARVEVYAHNVREVAEPFRGDSGDNPRPARRIQDPVIWMEYYVRKHQFGQGPAKRVHCLAFIQLWGIPF
jgi:hypothetical protein